MFSCGIEQSCFQSREEGESRELSSHALINRYLLNLQRPKKQLGQKPTCSLSWVPRSFGPVQPCYNWCQPWNCRESKIHLKTWLGHGQSRHCQESWGSCWVSGHTLGHGTHQPTLSSSTEHTHSLLPFSFVTHPEGPSTENVKLPATTSLPSRMLLTVYVPAGSCLLPKATARSTQTLLLKRSYCAGHPGGDTSVGASTRWEQRDPECCAILLFVPVSVPEGIPCLSPFLKASHAQLQLSPRPWHCVAVAV